ncbi:glycosyltransferase family 2 protein [Campylobacter concisus]
MLLDILIPTFNRIEPLKKNLELLIDYVSRLDCKDKIRIIISDNFSSDSTFDVLSILKSNTDIKIIIYRQEENIGLERNAVFVLSKSSAKYVMFLGDDDFLHFDYLKKIVEHLETDNLACIIPSFLAKRVDGAIVGYRSLGENKKYAKGFLSALTLSILGHQLSGIVFLREGILEKYLSSEEFRNIYLFIAFVGLNCLRGGVWHFTEYPVYVTVGEEKDWNYGDDALFSEKIKNIPIISENFLQRFRLENKFFIDNIYSIFMVYSSLSKRVKALYLASTSQNLSLVFKAYIPFLLFLFAINKITNKIFKKIGIR